jgi:AGZA family xanthine/uracil permease-like MFS transporter
VIFIFFFLDLFDAMGTLIGVSAPAGFLKDGKLPRANRAMLADALGTVGGTLLGTSTVSSYIESTTGIAQGARTGLANVFTSLLFVVALFFSPIVEMIGGEYVYNGMSLHPVIAPALIIVGYLMMKCVLFIKWEDLAEAIPAFLTIIVMPMTFSITEGIAFGFISYSLLKLVTGRGKEVHWIIYLFSALFVLRYIVK